MSTQTGPYREAETIEDDDVRDIAGVVHAGKVLRSPTSSWVALNRLMIAASDAVGILSLHA